jgi:hypothetical protein
MSTFKVNNVELSYCHHPYNQSYRNERTIEIPLGAYALNRLKELGETVELGAVMGFYQEIDHIMIDLYEVGHDKILNKNYLDCYDLKGKNLLSISTIEHIGWEEHGRTSYIGENMAAEAFDKAISESPYYFITTPVGAHPKLDKHIAKSNTFRVIMKRPMDRNIWVQHHDPNDFMFNYGHHVGSALAICITTNLPDFKV